MAHNLDAVAYLEREILRLRGIAHDYTRDYEKQNEALPLEWQEMHGVALVLSAASLQLENMQKREGMIQPVVVVKEMPDEITIGNIPYSRIPF